MEVDLYSIVFSPLFLSIFTVTLGMLLGNLKCLGRMKLGVGGPLFVGIFAGWGVSSLAQWISSGEYENSTGFFASLVTPENVLKAETVLESKVVPSALYSFMLILFVASVGLLASKDLNLVLKKYGAKFIAFGLIITLIGAGISYASQYMYDDTNINQSVGLFTGALTSSPGLSLAIEKSEKFAIQTARSENLSDAETNAMVNKAIADVNIGYAISYPFGMIAVILAMALLPKLFRINVGEELDRYKSEMSDMRKGSKVKEITPVTFDIKSFAFVGLLGYLIGMIEIYLGPLGYFSLGSTGGVLIASVLCGYMGKIGIFTFRMDGKVLGSIKDLALSFYVGMMGVNYGYEVVHAFVGNGLYFVIASIIVAVLCILIGFFIGHYVMKINYIMLSGAICGGMTSTPGLGMAIDAVGSDEPAAGYAAAYPSALIGMVLYVIIMYSIPVPM